MHIYVLLASIILWSVDSTQCYNQDEQKHNIHQHVNPKSTVA